MIHHVIMKQNCGFKDSQSLKTIPHKRDEGIKTIISQVLKI